MRNFNKNTQSSQIGPLIKVPRELAFWERGTGQEAIFTQAGLTSALLRPNIAVRTGVQRARDGSVHRGDT